MEVHEESIEAIIARHAGRPEMALIALQEIQSQAGYISAEALDTLANALGIPDGELQGLVSFYTELRQTPPGRHRICICQGDSCAATGSQRIAASVESLLGIRPNQTTPDRQFTYENIYCLGNCALSPAVSIDEQVYGRCSPDGVSEKLQHLQRRTDA